MVNNLPQSITDTNTLLQLVNEIQQSQYEKSDCDLYIGIKLNGEYAYVYGYATKNDFAELKLENLKIPTVGVLFSKLVEYRQAVSLV